MYYTEYDAQGNLKTSIIGDDREVAEAIKHHKGTENNTTKIKNSPTFEFTPKIVQKHITKYDTTNVQFSKPEVQKMFVGHEDELRRCVAKSIDNSNVASVFNATDILKLFAEHKNELRSIVANNLTSRNINVSPFSYENLKDIYKNDSEALQRIVDRRIAIDEANAERYNHDAKVRTTVGGLGIIGIICLTGYAIYKTFKNS